MTDTPAARSFGVVAERYDRYRPGYAPAAVAWASKIATIMKLGA